MIFVSCLLAASLTLLIWLSTAHAAPTIVTVSGHAVSNLEDIAPTPTYTAWNGCDGTTTDIVVEVGGTSQTTVPCATSNGAFSASVPVDGTQTIAVYFEDTNASTPASAQYARAVTYFTTTDTQGGVTDVGVGNQRVSIGTPSRPTSFTNASFTVWDSADDPYVPVMNDGADLTIPTDTTNGRDRLLFVNTGSTFEPGGDVTVDKLWLRGGTFDADANTLTLTGSGETDKTDCTNSSGVINATTGSETSVNNATPICRDTSAIFNAGTGTVVFTLANGPTGKTHIEGNPLSGTPWFAFNDLDVYPAQAFAAGNGIDLSFYGPNSAQDMDLGANSNTVEVDFDTNASSTRGPFTVNTGVIEDGATIESDQDFGPSGAIDVTGSLTSVGNGSLVKNGNGYGLDIYADVPEAGGTVTVGSTAGSGDWQFGTLYAYTDPGGATPGTVRLASGGTGTFTPGSVQVSNGSTYTATTTLDLQTADREVDVGWNQNNSTAILVGTLGVIEGAPTAPLTTVRGGYLHDHGVIDGNGGTFSIDDGVTLYDNGIFDAGTSLLYTNGPSGYLALDDTSTYTETTGGISVNSGDIDLNDTSIMTLGSGGVSIVGGMDIGSGATLNAGSATVGVESVFTVSGTFNYQTSTIAFFGGAPSSVSAGHTLTFYNLENASSGKMLRLPRNYGAIAVDGTFTVDGSSCSARSGIGSTNWNASTPANRVVEVDAANVALQYADIGDLKLGTAATADQSYDEGNNANITFTSECSAAQSISGHAFEIDGTTPWSGCDGSTDDIFISINGFETFRTTCSETDGSYSVSNVSLEPDVIVTVVLESAAYGSSGDGGVTFHQTGDTVGDLTGIDVRHGQARVTSDSADPISSTTLTEYDGNLDPSIPESTTWYTGATSWGSQIELYIDAGVTFDQNDSLSATAVDIAGTLNASGDTSQSFDLTGQGTDANCGAALNVSVPLCIRSGGSITFSSTENVNYYMTGDTNIAAAAYPRLALTNSAGADIDVELGTSTTANTITTAGDFDVYPNGAHQLNVLTSAFDPDVTVSGTYDGEGVGANLLGSGTGTFSVSGQIEGSTNIDLTAGTFDIDDQEWSGEGAPNIDCGAPDTFIVYDMTITSTAATGSADDTDFSGCSLFHVLHDMTLGTPGDVPGSDAIDLYSNVTLQVDHDLTVDSGGTAETRGGSDTYVVGGDVTVNDGGDFDAGFDNDLVQIASGLTVGSGGTYTGGYDTSGGTAVIGDVENDGTLDVVPSGGGTTVASFTVGGEITNAGVFDVSQGALVSVTGTFTNTASGQVYAHGSSTLSLDGDLDNAGGFCTNYSANLTVGGNLDNSANSSPNNSCNETGAQFYPAGTGTISVTGNLVNTGEFYGPMGGTLKVADNLEQNGTWDPDDENGGTGVVEFDGSGTSSLIESANSAFAYVTVDPTVTNFDLQSGTTTTIDKSFTAIGPSCAVPMAIASTTPGAQFTLSVASPAMQDIESATLQDANASPAIVVLTNGFGTNVTGFSFDDNLGGCSPPPDTGLTQGVSDPTNLAMSTPTLSWINEESVGIDAQQTRVLSTPITANIVGLYHFDTASGQATDSSPAGLYPLTAHNSPGTAAGLSTTLAQAAQLNGTNQYFDMGNTYAFHLSNDFTIEAWVQVASTSADQTIVERSSGADYNYRIAFIGGKIAAQVTDSSATNTTTISANPWEFDDGGWHEVALTMDASNNVTLYVDGIAVANGTVDSTAWRSTGNLSIGRSTSSPHDYLHGAVDDVEVSSTPYTADFLRGYVRLHMPHGLDIWDSGAGSVSCASGVRCPDVTYGSVGPAPVAPIPVSGARVYPEARMQLASGLWTKWSSGDYYEMDGALTVSAPDGNVDLGIAMPGTNARGTSRIDVTSDQTFGYELLVTDSSDTTSLTSGAASFADWTGLPAVPTPWSNVVYGATNSHGYFGVSELSAIELPSGSNEKNTALWGTGTTNTDADDDPASPDLDWAGVGSSVPTVLWSRPPGYSGSDEVNAAYRAGIPAGQPPGTYSDTLTYTAISLP